MEPAVACGVGVRHGHLHSAAQPRAGHGRAQAEVIISSGRSRVFRETGGAARAGLSSPGWAGVCFVFAYREPRRNSPAPERGCPPSRLEDGESSSRLSRWGTGGKTGPGRYQFNTALRQSRRVKLLCNEIRATGSPDHCASCFQGCCGAIPQGAHPASQPCAGHGGAQAEMIFTGWSVGVG